jgi:hypothetical protein
MLGSGKIIMWGDWMSEETKIKIFVYNEKEE